MLHKSIKYVGIDGLEREEDFYFNLTESELTELQLSVHGGISEALTKAAKTINAPALVMFFKDLIWRSYGEKSPDGRRFIKSPELSKEFSETPAYDVLFMELISDVDAAQNFALGIMPLKLRDEYLKQNPK